MQGAMLFSLRFPDGDTLLACLCLAFTARDIAAEWKPMDRMPVNGTFIPDRSRHDGTRPCVKRPQMVRASVDYPPADPVSACWMLERH